MKYFNEPTGQKYKIDGVVIRDNNYGDAIYRADEFFVRKGMGAEEVRKYFLSVRDDLNKQSKELIFLRWAPDKMDFAKETGLDKIVAHGVGKFAEIAVYLMKDIPEAEKPKLEKVN